MSDEYVLFYQGRNPMEAHMLAGLLEDNGLEPHIEQEDIATLFGGMSPVDQGVRILIRKSQREQALRVVRDVETEAGFYGFETDDSPALGDSGSGAGTSDVSPSPFKWALKIGKYPVAIWQVLGVIVGLAGAVWILVEVVSGDYSIFKWLD